MESQKQLTQQFGSKPGSYDLVIRISKPILDPGDKVHFEVYICGYGFIESASVNIYPSWTVFSIADSNVSIGDSKALPWDPLGRFVDFNNQSFFDAKGRYQISTECKTPAPASKSPINLDMNLMPKVRPGIYSIHFVLKYYNGDMWNTKSTSTNFTVRNFYQRHETFVWILGGIAAFLTVISAIFPFLKWLWIKLSPIFQHHA